MESNRKKFGRNEFKKGKKQGFFKKLFAALSEPMMIILMIAWAVTLGTGLGKYFKNGEKDFSGCIGVFIAIAVSVGLTLIMEKSSQKAFEKLAEAFSDIKVKVIRNGKIDTLFQSELVVGDIVLVESGSKISADGILAEGEELSVDESALTGESREVHKSANGKNNLYSGTFVLSGSGKYIVTAVGQNAEIGKIASNLFSPDSSSPLTDKLARLGKKVTLIGGIMSAVAFVLTVIRLAIFGNFSFDSVGDAFISSVILIVAVVPEGLPTTVAVSLALNMTRLSKKKVLVKKLTASETAGAVSVICTDKTGTLTENKMTVERLCFFDNCTAVEKGFSKYISENFCINTTADLAETENGLKRIGSPTECSLLEAYEKSSGKPYGELRKNCKILSREPFSSDRKYMSTTALVGGVKRVYFKGAPEKVLAMCSMDDGSFSYVKTAIYNEEKKGRRILAFAHSDKEENKISYDGFVSIIDPIREDVFGAVDDCKRAGIEVKMLTGDNIETASEIASRLNITKEKRGVYTASEIDGLTDNELDSIVSDVKVVARSTPMTKLRLVSSLKRNGEVVAVTGDGMNDAPAIKNADIGIAMGISGSEISREAADVVLLDDSFSSIVTAITFGRKLYLNIQKFVTFQLTVNFAAVMLVVLSLLAGLNTPFNTLQLLWINIIMDGPPALSLGLGTGDKGLLNQKPVKREASLVTKRMAIRIALQGVICTLLCFLQSRFNFLRVGEGECAGVVFSLFVVMQLFNAFNCIEIGKKSIFGSLKDNKIMLFIFGITLALQVLICSFGGAVFTLSPISLISWLKIIALASSSIIVSELYKLIYRTAFSEKRNKRGFKPIHN